MPKISSHLTLKLHIKIPSIGFYLAQVWKKMLIPLMIIIHTMIPNGTLATAHLHLCQANIKA